MYTTSPEIRRLPMWVDSVTCEAEMLSFPPSPEACFRSSEMPPLSYPRGRDARRAIRFRKSLERRFCPGASALDKTGLAVTIQIGHVGRRYLEPDARFAFHRASASHD